MMIRAIIALNEYICLQCQNFYATFVHFGNLIFPFIAALALFLEILFQILTH